MYPSLSYFLPFSCLFQIIKLFILPLCQYTLILHLKSFFGSLFTKFNIQFRCFSNPSLPLFANLLPIWPLCLVLLWFLTLLLYFTIQITFECFLFMLAWLLFVLLFLFWFLLSLIGLWFFVFFLLFKFCVLWASVFIALTIWVVTECIVIVLSEPIILRLASI